MTASDCSPQEGCITCGDVGIAMTVLEVDAAGEMALCEAQDGAHSSVEIELVSPVAPGEAVLVHAGVALVRVESPEEVPVS